jgi:calcineurin-like phosphoesterase family protein
MIYFGSDFHFNDVNILKYQYERKTYGNNINAINNNLISR